VFKAPLFYWGKYYIMFLIRYECVLDDKLVGKRGKTEMNENKADIGEWTRDAFE